MNFYDDNHGDDSPNGFLPNMSNMGGFRSRHGSHRSTSDLSSVSPLPWSNGSVLDNICTVIVVICLILCGLVNAGVIKPQLNPAIGLSPMRKARHRLGRHPAVLRKTNSSRLTQRLQIHRIRPESSATGMIHAANTVNISTKSKPCMTSTMPCRQPRSMNMSKRFRTPNQRLIHGSRP